MRRALLLAFALLSHLAQAQERPQMGAAEAASYGIKDYLGDWQPAPLDASKWKADFIVAADGSGTHRTVQAALDAVPSTGRRHFIQIKPGSYREQVCLKSRAPVTLYGQPGDAAAVLIVNGHFNAEPAASGGMNPCVANGGNATTVGTAGSASVALVGNDIQLAHLTVANDAMDKVRDGTGYPANVGESGGAQAVALMLEGDRVQLENVRLLGHQDTFLARSGRVFVRRSLIAGDVDFIFGAATLAIDDSTILSRAGRRKPGHEALGGHVLAPSTAWNQRYGFLVVNTVIAAEPGVPPASISLGRAWDSGVPKGEWQANKSPNGQALIRDSELGAHLAPWAASTSRRAFSAVGPMANRFHEFNNSRDLSREALAAGNGWASADGGTRGGADATPADVFEVRNRAELVAAFAKAGNRPKIVRVRGRIDLSDGLAAEAFRDPAYDFEAFLKAYDPATWGKKPPEGPLEDARRRSAKRQAAQIVVPVPSNTTVMGVGPDAGFTGGMLFLDKAANVILRNLNFADAYDHFPAWDPKDNANGEWNSEYDPVSLRGATHVWVDHCAFDDGARPDQAEPIALGRRIQHHDGLLDITHQSNYVTLSWNRFAGHDKTMLIGGSDGHKTDEGKLKITLHHNLFEQVKERTPRVRYGQVHVFNNLFVGRSDVPYAYGYSIGVGVGSAVLSERNAWETSADIPTSRLVKWWKGQRFLDRGSLHNGKPADLLAELRSTAPGAEISAELGWQPPYAFPQDEVTEIAARVRAGAGAGRDPR